MGALVGLGSGAGVGRLGGGGSGTVFTCAGGESLPDAVGGVAPIPGPRAPVARQAAVVAAPAPQIATIF